MPECAVSDWSDWSQCDQTCGQAIHTRSRSALGGFQTWRLAKIFLPLFQSKACEFKQICLEDDPTDDFSISDYY